MSNEKWNIDFDTNSFKLKNEGGLYTNLKVQLNHVSMVNAYNQAD